MIPDAKSRPAIRFSTTIRPLAFVLGPGHAPTLHYYKERQDYPAHGDFDFARVTQL